MHVPYQQVIHHDHEQIHQQHRRQHPRTEHIRAIRAPFPLCHRRHRHNGQTANHDATDGPHADGQQLAAQLAALAEEEEHGEQDEEGAGEGEEVDEDGGEGGVDFIEVVGLDGGVRAGDLDLEVVAHPGEGAGEGFVEGGLDEGAVAGGVVDLLVVDGEVRGHDVGALEGGEVVELLVEGVFDLVGEVGGVEVGGEVDEGGLEAGGDLGEFAPDGEAGEALDDEDDADVEGEVQDDPEVLADGAHAVGGDLVEVEHPHEVEDADGADDGADDVGGVDVVGADLVDGFAHADDAFAEDDQG